MASTIIYSIAAVIILVLFGLNVAVMFKGRKAQIIGFVGGFFTFPFMIGAILAIVLIEKDMDLPRFIVGCMLISGGTIGYIFGMCSLAEKAEAK